MPGTVVSRLIRPFDLPAMKWMAVEIQATLREIPVDFGGGCTYAKARVLAELIRRYNLQTTVDIGVYRGRSLIPQAIAHARYTGGKVYGVDPWSAVEAAEYDTASLLEPLGVWLTTTDFDRLYQEVAELIRRSGLDRHCRLVRQTSRAAIVFFRQQGIYFDLIHIDGNHDTRIVMEDLALYVPRLKPGGFVVLDDISWDSVKPAYRRLRATLSLLYTQTDRANDYAVFWRGPAGTGRTRRALVALAAARKGTRWWAPRRW